jgi:hypothetical protein
MALSPTTCGVVFRVVYNNMIISHPCEHRFQRSKLMLGQDERTACVTVAPW